MGVWTGVLLPFSEQVGEMLVVEQGCVAAVVDGLAHYNHRGEGEVVFLDDAGQVLELTTVDALVGPGQVVASGDGSVSRILLKELCLHIIHDAGAEEDTHCALASCQQVEFLFLWHGCASFTSGKDDGLAPFGDGELRA